MANTPEYYMTITLSNDQQVKLSMRELAARLGIYGTISAIRIGMDRDRIGLHASMSCLESDYPGIMVDGKTPACGDVYIANVELPCETYPTRIAARLYAGCHRYETDEPIAIVTHEVTDDARVDYRADMYGEGNRAMTKLVYVDHSVAASRHWAAAGENNLPEHQEDERKS